MAEIISEDTNRFHGVGTGFMMHPMWMRMPDNSWLCTREKSCMFGWKGYSSRFA
jgi:hypothetical protein